MSLISVGSPADGVVENSAGTAVDGPTGAPASGVSGVPGGPTKTADSCVPESGNTLAWHLQRYGSGCADERHVGFSESDE
ncbi:hypothetical protein [Haladaptatus caseinilyticus]|uniref:hypothetical protein n=1 Tax=Haladaptatus caseinilyticus TaxID=2993314 RepID=UPI00224AAE92|nr:hypothetical protein [Haladaptatus caseinilyticus]